MDKKKNSDLALSFPRRRCKKVSYFNHRQFMEKQGVLSESRFLALVIDQNGSSPNHRRFHQKILKAKLDKFKALGSGYWDVSRSSVLRRLRPYYIYIYAAGGLSRPPPLLREKCGCQLHYNFNPLLMDVKMFPFE